MHHQGMIDFDRVLTDIGEFGKYQQLVVLLLCLPACFMNAYHQHSLPYLTFTPEHRCRLPPSVDQLQLHSADNATTITAPIVRQFIKATSCDIEHYKDNKSMTEGKHPFRKEKCDRWEYDTYYFTETFITKFDLVCDRAIIGNNVLAVLSFALVVGSLLFSYVQDLMGRQAAFLLSVASCVLPGVASVFAPSVLLFAVLRFIVSLNGVAAWNVGYIWAIEFVGPSKRTLVTTIMSVIYAIATISLSLVGFLTRDWVEMGLVLSVPFTLLVLFPLVISESPRWLLTKGRFAEAKKVILRIQRWSHRRSYQTRQLDDTVGRMARQALGLATADVEMIDAEVARMQEQLQHIPPSASILQLFSGKQMRAKTLVVTICWVANAIAYTTMIFNTQNLGGDFYITFALQAAVEAPATLINLFVINRIGRIWPLAGGMVMGGICCALTAAAEGLLGNTAVLVLAIMGKFFICMTYAVMYQVATELYPTTVRGVGIGFSCVVGNLFNVFMPYIIATASSYRMLPMLIIGLIAITAGLIGFTLPETMNEPLPETLNEAELSGIVSFATARGHFRRLFNSAHRQAPQYQSEPTESPTKERLAVSRDRLRNGVTADEEELQTMCAHEGTPPKDTP